MALDPKMPVLVVDDYSTMVRIIRNLLRQLGFADVDDASDGAAALDKMRSKRYGLVISDWNMEPMTGFDLLQQVRADPELETTPFIMVTAESKTENVIAAKKAGVNNYIVKPFNAQTLKAKIEAVFAEKAEFTVATLRALAAHVTHHFKSAHDRLRRNAGGGKDRIERAEIGRLARSRTPRHGCRRSTNMQSSPNAAAPLRSVRTESPMASTRLRAGARAAAQRRGRGERRLVDRRMRLAAIKHLAAERRVGVGERAGAIDQRVAALDDDVGIGADHEQRARAHRREHVAVALRRLRSCRRTGRSTPRSRRLSSGAKATSRPAKIGRSRSGPR